MTAEEFLGIKEYLKQALSLDFRTDLEGNNHLCLLLEDEPISILKFEVEND